jgi:hypothetical protein
MRILVVTNSLNGKPKASVFARVVSRNTDAFGLPLNETGQSRALKENRKVAQSNQGSVVKVA